MPIVNIERFSRVVFQTIEEWPEQDISDFLEVINAHKMSQDDDEPEVWESDHPAFRVSILRKTWPNDSE